MRETVAWRRDGSAFRPWFRVPVVAMKWTPIEDLQEEMLAWKLIANTRS
jgi:hypothetical protein